MPDPNEGRKEACRTYLEQTKLLTALASAFLLAPAALLGFLRPATGEPASSGEWLLVAAGEFFLVSSIVLGYVVAGSLAGSQHDGNYDVYRPATRVASLAQLTSLLFGIACLMMLGYAVLQPSGSPRLPAGPEVSRDR